MEQQGEGCCRVQGRPLHKRGPLQVPCFWWVESAFKPSQAEGCGEAMRPLGVKPGEGPVPKAGTPY